AGLDVETEPFQRLHARLAGLDLEAVAAGEGEQCPMSPSAQGNDETGHRLRAACPPAIGDEMENSERSRGHAPLLERPASTSSYRARSLDTAATWEKRPSTSFRAARARTAAAAGSAMTASMAAARSDGSSGLTRRPVSPSAMTSGIPPMALPTAGMPAAKACRSDCGTPSVRVEARTKQSMARRRSGTSLRKPVK